MAKKPSKTVRLSIRIEGEEKKTIEKTASRRGMSFSAAVREACVWWSGLTDGGVRMVRGLAQQNHVAEGQVLENLMLDSLAYQESEDVVNGYPGPIEVFPKLRDGTVVTGEDFLIQRKKTWERRLWELKKATAEVE